MAIAMHENILKMQTLNPYPRPTESATLGVGQAVCALRSPPDDSDMCQSLRTTDSEGKGCRIGMFSKFPRFQCASRDENHSYRPKSSSSQPWLHIQNTWRAFKSPDAQAAGPITQQSLEWHPSFSNLPRGHYSVKLSLPCMLKITL